MKKKKEETLTKIKYIIKINFKFMFNNINILYNQ